jgi:hypothetical protein
MSRKSLSIVLLVLLLAVGATRGAARAATDLDAPTIKAALQTVDKEEQGFVERAVAQVAAGTLPRKTLETAFLWAKRKPSNKFQYFRRALILLAARQGIIVK